MNNQKENSNNKVNNNETSLYYHCNKNLEKSKNHEPSSLINTGFSNIDKTLQGLHPGKLYVIAGAEGMPKALLAGQIALNVADHSGVLYMPVLESASRLTNRLIRAVADISDTDLEHVPWDNKRVALVEKTMDSFKTKKLFIDKLWRYDEEELLHLIESYIKDQDVSMIIIDDEKCLFSRMKKKLSSHEKYHFLLKLKMLLRKSDCCGVLLKKIKPAEQTEDNPYRLPSVKDFRTGYNLAELADEIWMIHRLEYYGLMVDGDNNKTTGRTELYHIDEYESVRNTLYFTFKSGATYLKVLEDPASQ
jgi:replicative DNA helicase